MPAGDKLSDVQEQTLVTLLEQGRLERWPGGFWTIPGCPVKKSSLGARGDTINVPSWYVEIGTVRALERRGYLTFTKHKGAMEIEATPTQKARDLI